MPELDRLRAAIQCSGTVVILEETTSTQDAALAYGLQAGDVCIAVQQTSGRGRRGNTWNADGGVALTVVAEQATPLLSIAVAASLAEQLERQIQQAVGIKWPNDLLVDGKKLAGILIEQREGVCLIGVGVNVEPLDQRGAVSLVDLGCTESYEVVARGVVAATLDARALSPERAISLWQARDVLIGTTQTVTSNNNSITGTVLAIDPLHHLLLETDAGQIALNASTTTFH
ncbi:MAG: biotin--[acetyl-CoA-carboxylase] ligase [Phycisphaerales bacterium]|jgi:BirA family biotin operon repressor/biotin-[acetyl-CoA-carboxylase] ligase|nr:biotin--[acetyl-CoA-carboxylase] ligase [Phycisphaerales bacterium]